MKVDAIIGSPGINQVRFINIVIKQAYSFYATLISFMGFKETKIKD